MKCATIYTLLLMFTAAWCQAVEYREFTSTSGQKMMARPVNIIGKQVRIEREDGQEFNVTLDMFSEKDQEYLREWMLAKLANDGRLFTIQAKEGGTRKEKTGSKGTSSMVYKTWEGYYKLIIQNDSDLALKDLRIEYRYYIFDDDMGATKRSEGDTKVTKGELKISLLGPRKTAELETIKTRMQESELGAGWYYSNGGDRGSKDKLEGLRMRIYKGDLLLVDYSEPSTLREQHKW